MGEEGRDEERRTYNLLVIILRSFFDHPATKGVVPTILITYGHRYWKTRDPVRSPIDKPIIARLVVGSVTTSESLVLYVFLLLSVKETAFELPPDIRLFIIA